MIILSDDPGSRNYGRTIQQVTKHKKRLVTEVLWAGLVRNPIRDLRGDLQDQCRKFRRELKYRANRFQIDRYIAERYMTRGIKGTTIECVNLMLGINLTVLSEVPQTIIPAASWKNAFNRQLDLDAWYERLKPHHVPPHVLDSALIGMYAAFLAHDMKPFQGWRKRDMLDLIAQISAGYIPVDTRPEKTKRKRKKRKVKVKRVKKAKTVKGAKTVNKGRTKTKKRGR